MGRRTALPQENFEELYANANDPKVRLKLLTLLQLKEGKTIKETTEVFKVHRDTVRNWIKRSGKGLIGFTNKPMSGRKTKLKKEDEEAFKKVFKEESDKRIGGRLTGQDIQQILAKEFKAVYSLTGVYRLLKRLKIVWITSRSIHPKQDPLVQEDFKKTSKKCRKDFTRRYYA